MSNVRDIIRQEVLLDGLIDWVGLPRIQWVVEQQLPGADASELQRVTIETIRSLADRVVR